MRTLSTLANARLHSSPLSSFIGLRVHLTHNSAHIITQNSPHPCALGARTWTHQPCPLIRQCRSLDVDQSRASIPFAARKFPSSVFGWFELTHTTICSPSTSLASLFHENAPVFASPGLCRAQNVQPNNQYNSHPLVNSTMFFTRKNGAQPPHSGPL